jgi:hypothetical protein
MNDTPALLFSSPWFWIVLILVILIIAFRAQLARLIDRLQKVNVEAGKGGAKVGIESPISDAPKQPAVTTPSSVASAPLAPRQSVEVGREADMKDVEMGDIGNTIVKDGAATSPGSASNQTVEVGHGATMQGVTIGDIGNVIVRGGAADAARPAATGWTTALIRELLTAAFSDEELTSLCFDYFRPVYQGFAAGMSAGQKMQRLLDYCESQLCMDKLLTLAQQRNPAQFARFQVRVNRA